MRRWRATRDSRRCTPSGPMTARPCLACTKPQRAIGRIGTGLTSQAVRTARKRSGSSGRRRRLRGRHCRAIPSKARFSHTGKPWICTWNTRATGGTRWWHATGGGFGCWPTPQRSRSRRWVRFSPPFRFARRHWRKPPMCPNIRRCRPRRWRSAWRWTGIPQGDCGSC